MNASFSAQVGIIEGGKIYKGKVTSYANQIGLLAFIVSEFDKENINIATAKIHTTNNRARDHFLIEKKENSKEDLQRVINKLLED